MPIFWQRDLVRPVQDWDSLSFSDCQQLLRRLYRRAGMVPLGLAARGAAAHAGRGVAAWARAMGGVKRPMPSG